MSTSDFQSSDVAVHVVGHTAEFVARRSQADVKMIVSHRAVSETGAYFATSPISSPMARDRNGNWRRRPSCPVNSTRSS